MLYAVVQAGRIVNEMAGILKVQAAGKPCLHLQYISVASSFPAGAVQVNRQKG